MINGSGNESPRLEGEGLASPASSPREGRAKPVHPCSGLQSLLQASSLLRPSCNGAQFQGLHFELGKGARRIHVETPRLRIVSAVGPLETAVLSLLAIPDIGCEFQVQTSRLPESLTHLAEFRNHLAVTLKEGEKVVGFLGLLPSEACPRWEEISYGVHPDYRGQGIVREGLRGILPGLVVDEDLEGVFARIFRRNTASLTVARSLGMQPVPWPHLRDDVMALALDREKVLKLAPYRSAK